jgi:hypothetical protein
MSVHVPGSGGIDRRWGRQKVRFTFTSPLGPASTGNGLLPVPGPPGPTG